MYFLFLFDFNYWIWKNKKIIDHLSFLRYCWFYFYQRGILLKNSIARRTPAQFLKTSENNNIIEIKVLKFYL
jgi:hypothetical protein